MNNSSLMSLGVQQPVVLIQFSSFCQMLWSPGDAVRKICFQHKFELCSGGRSILGTATLTLVSHSSLQTCPKSCDVPVMPSPAALLPFHVVMLLLQYYLLVPTAHCSCRPQSWKRLSPSNVGGTACDNPTLLAPVKAAVGDVG